MRRNEAQRIFTLMLLATLFAGCGSSVTDKTGGGKTNLTAASPEFPNAALLVAADSLQASLNAGGLTIIDARSATAYSAAHIPGAVNIQHSAFWTKGAGLKDSAIVASQLGAA